jgi:hypothetical protein
MAGSKTNYAEGKLLDLMMGNQSWMPGANSVLALYTVAPTETGGGTEANYAGYARKTVTNDLTTWPSANPKLNGIELAFPEATGGQAGDIVAVACFESAGVNMIAYATLTTPKPVFTGDTPRFPAGSLSFTED